MAVCKCGTVVRGDKRECRRCAALNVLDLKAGASEQSIKAAYRRQVKEWHPDRHGKDKAKQPIAEEKTKRINAAYEYLSLWGLLQYVMSDPKSDLVPAKRKLIDIKLKPALAATRESIENIIAKFMAEIVKP
jgi:hypothetical protein